MKLLNKLISDFWVWTGLPEEMWNRIDIADISIDTSMFPKIGEVCNECNKLVNKELTYAEANAYLFGLALDSEDEDILEYCVNHADVTFIYKVLSLCVSYPHSEARWQIAELLRREIPQRDYFLMVLRADSNEYVRQRANNVINDIRNI